MCARPGGTNSAAQSCTLLRSPDGAVYEPAGTPGGVQATHKRHAPPEMRRLSERTTSRARARRLPRPFGMRPPTAPKCNGARAGALCMHTSRGLEA